MASFSRSVIFEKIGHGMTCSRSFCADGHERRAVLQVGAGVEDLQKLRKRQASGSAGGVGCEVSRHEGPEEIAPPDRYEATLIFSGCPR